MSCKNIIKIFILIVLFIIVIILNNYKSEKSIIEDIMIFGLWNENGAENEYEITIRNAVQINVFSTINKKIAPGSKGSFVIKFKRPKDLEYIIQVDEKTSKPHNLFFMLDGKKYSTIKEMEKAITEKFQKTEEITINWEWKYHINETDDIQDTYDGKNAITYIFEIQAIVEEQERKMYET